MQKKRKLIIGIVVVVLLIGIVAGLYFSKSFLFEGKRKFDVDNVLLKLTVRQGEFVSKSLKITNTDSKNADFEISKQGLDFISVSDREFSLEPGEIKTLELDFDIKNKDAGVYLGEVLVSSCKTVLNIPVILEIETREVLFDSNINVPPEYSSVYPGEKAIIETQIFNLENMDLKTVGVNYFVRDFKGNTIFSAQENIAVETHPLTTKIIPIPKDAETGNYVFVAVVEYSDSVGTSSYFFKIAKKTFKMDDAFFMWIVIFLLFGLIFFIIYYVRQRDKMFLELQRQYRTGMSREVKRQKAVRMRIKKIKSPRKRRVELRIFSKKRKKRLRAIKKIHRARVKVIRKLKKQKKKSQALGKLAQWKRQGYNVNEFLIKTGQKQSLKGQAAKLKKQGYGI